MEDRKLIEPSAEALEKAQREGDKADSSHPSVNVSEEAINAVVEYVTMACNHASRIKRDSAHLSQETRDRAQAQADAYRIVLTLMREKNLINEDDSRWKQVAPLATTARNVYIAPLCGIDREIMTFKRQNAEIQEYECPNKHRWDFHWRD